MPENKNNNNVPCLVMVVVRATALVFSLISLSRLRADAQRLFGAKCLIGGKMYYRVYSGSGWQCNEQEHMAMQISFALAKITVNDAMWRDSIKFCGVR